MLQDKGKFIEATQKEGEEQAKVQAAATISVVKLVRHASKRDAKQKCYYCGHDFEADPIIKLSKTNTNALVRSENILNNPNLPVTAKDLNLTYNDYIIQLQQVGPRQKVKLRGNYLIPGRKTSATGRKS